jgi:hypothetical protein
MDLFIKLLLSSLTRNVRKWSDKVPRKRLKTYEDLEQIFLQMWGIKEDMISLYSYYL